ncbi:hypothetical protein P171DRAFT_255622 [Karstenula rhodostoma CBS 690.94]|uniref:Uncharacterized protein n=1 Tax=Karstenula rhodostoma CBS 690.94 TaxID=1392251 RepID=A0A9P4PN79_9PLEO|nr:hypothetical protein P171DRAFT_255622 [Karstenula rhodostoma CBS 690.94]
MQSREYATQPVCFTTVHMASRVGACYVCEMHVQGGPGASRECKGARILTLAFVVDAAVGFGLELGANLVQQLVEALAGRASRRPDAGGIVVHGDGRTRSIASGGGVQLVAGARVSGRAGCFWQVERTGARGCRRTRRRVDRDGGRGCAKLRERCAAGWDGTDAQPGCSGGGERTWLWGCDEGEV